MSEIPRPSTGIFSANNRARPGIAAALCVVMVVLRMGAMAAEEGTGSDDESRRPFKHYTLEQLMALDVQAPTKFEQPVREAPTVGTVITREQIDGYGWLTLEEMLLRQTGFAPSQDYERVTVSSRGQYESWNNNHLRLLVDGIPVNNVFNGTAYVWDMMPLSMIESVEIMRGPGSALYGSNATNGVIAINTRKISEQGELQTKAGFGNAGTRDIDVFGGRAYPWFRFSTGYRYQGTDGNIYNSYDSSRRTGPDGRLLKFKVNDEHAAHSGFLKLEGQGPLAGLSLQAHVAWWKFETAQGWLQIIPDEPERAHNSREIVSLSYRPAPLLGERLQLEVVGEAQHREIDYRIKFLPDNFVYAGTLFPSGLTEVLDATSVDYFGRMQADYRIAGDMRILFGVENTVYLAEEDNIHESNVDLNRGGTFLPFPDNQLHTLRSTTESVADHPIENMGLFLQLCSGRVLKRMVSATAGLRYDFLDVNYFDLDQADRPLVEKYLDQFSPRLGLVFYPHPNLTLKALAERAFRAPSPIELFSANSLLFFSNPGPLQPENMTAYTLAADLTLIRHCNLRTDWFYQKFDNQIAFSGTRNFTSNIYSRTVTGLETEVLFDAALGAAWSLSGFLNYTLVHQLHEKVLEPQIAMSDRLTWAPEQVANLGCILTRQKLTVSLQGHYQGSVYRRTSDYLQADGTPTAFSAYRPGSLDPWVTLDAAIGYRIQNGLHLRLRGTNILDQRGFLMKPGDFPFDYQIEGARVLASVEYSLPNQTFGFRPSAEGR